MWEMTDSTPRKYTYFQFGLQRTGTTIVDRVIRDSWNYFKANDAEQYKADPYHPQPQMETNWKHHIDVPNNLPEGAPVILVYKCPYTWAESMAFRRGSGNGGWSISWGHENMNLYPQPKPQWNNISTPGQGVTNIGQIMYVYKHWFGTWLEYAKNNPDTCYTIKYEDLLVRETRNQVLNEIGAKFGWETRTDDYPFPNHVGSSQPMDENRTSYYINCEPKDPRFFVHGRRYVQSINDILGQELIEGLGYKFL